MNDQHSPDPDDGATLARSAQFEQDVLAPLRAIFIGKNEIIDLIGIALIAGENLFMLGPPGTAKSAIVNQLSSRLNGRTFEYLLTRFTEPNELFGPFDIRRLREGELVTNTQNMLPEADFVFLDELLNANSAILNSLLTALNERVLRRGRETFKLPVISIFGASNHLPEDDSLGALFDRFLLRVLCENVGNEDVEQVLDAGWRLEAVASLGDTTFSVEDLRSISNLIPKVGLGPTRECYSTLVRHLRQAGFEYSDRRAVKVQRLIAASALSCGRLTAHPSDLWVARHTWDRLEQRPVLDALISEAMGDVEPGSEEQSHPRARQLAGVDAELVARELDELRQRAEQQLAERDRVLARDRLLLLESRIEWVDGDEPRLDLRERCTKLWKLLGS